MFPQLKRPLNSAISQQFGRRLYSATVDDQKLWVKTQIRNISPMHEISFQHELAVYETFSIQLPKLIVPYQRLDRAYLNNYPLAAETDKPCSAQREYADILILEDTAALFACSPHQLSKQQIVKIMFKSVELIEQMYAGGYLHADLKVEHFRISSQGEVKLIDFEQCLILNSCIHIDSHAGHTATPRYMAPELFHAQPKSIASELYAIGIIWLEWLNQDKIKHSSYLDWAKWHCQVSFVQLPLKFQCFESILNMLLDKQKTRRCTNFYQIKQILSDIV